MRRHRTKLIQQTTAPAVHSMRAVKGLFVRMFVDRADIGSGWRHFMVLRCSHKGVTLFYPPLLKAFRIPLGDWNLNRISSYEGNPLILLELIAKGMNTYKRDNRAFNFPNAKAALVILVALVRERKEQPK